MLFFPAFAENGKIFIKEDKTKKKYFLKEFLEISKYS